VLGIYERMLRGGWTGMKTYRVTWFIAGVILGVIACLGRGPTIDKMQRDYAAYRTCIPKPGCMTATDYIDYYNLKWELEDP